MEFKFEDRIYKLIFATAIAKRFWTLVNKKPEKKRAQIL